MEPDQAERNRAEPGHLDSRDRWDGRCNPAAGPDHGPTGRADPGPRERSAAEEPALPAADRSGRARQVRTASRRDPADAQDSPAPHALRPPPDARNRTDPDPAAQDQDQERSQAQERNQDQNQDQSQARSRSRGRNQAPGRRPGPGHDADRRRPATGGRRRGCER
ncbi:hypothetical protein FB565_001447 [Actinoplanes lutulentus]|nr:hypothetical protein [Actinoplanes lutulentus]